MRWLIQAVAELRKGSKTRTLGRAKPWSRVSRAGAVELGRAALMRWSLFLSTLARVLVYRNIKSIEPTRAKKPGYALHDVVDGVNRDGRTNLVVVGNVHLGVENIAIGCQRFEYGFLGRRDRT